MPFPPNPKILTLPVSLHGLGLPSIARINAGIAVDGLSRDLNHHISAYRTMARITLAEWTCSVNGCIYPLDGIGLRKGFSRYNKKIPSAWIIAQAALASLDPPLSLRLTDQSHILRGDVSISHIIALCNNHRPSSLGTADGNTLRTLRSKGIRTLADLGEWCGDLISESLTFVVDPGIPQRGRWTPAQRANWSKIVDTLQPMRVSWLFDGTTDLLLTRDARRNLAEQRIRALVPCCRLQSSSSGAGSQAWASDGSMVPASATLSDDRSVMAAATGPSTLVLKLMGRNLSILHGELMGQIIGLVLCEKGTTSSFYSDHQNSIQLIDEIRAGVSLDSRLRGLNGRSYYRWILQLVCEKRVTVTYTRGHSAELTLPAQMNREADHYASGAQRHRNLVPIAPVPSFFMDDYTLHRPADGWIESNVRSYAEHFLGKQSAAQLAIGNRLRMLTAVHDHLPPPEYPYTRAISAHSAVIQLYARSGQLPTGETLENRSKLASPLCRLGCAAIESAHHIFVHCPTFDEWRLTATSDVLERTRGFLLAAEVPQETLRNVLKAAESLFLDDFVVWPLKMSQYYIGQIPSVESLLPSDAVRDLVKRRRLLSRISMEWHTSAIRLAGRIFGHIQRTTAALHAIS